jgi:DNA-binding NtrC family response regulator
MLLIERREGGGSVRREFDAQRLTIGRGDDNDLILSDDIDVSWHHAEIRWRHDAWIVADLGSTNGTRVNGLQVLDPHPLESGDEIAVGTRKLEFHSGRERAAGVVARTRKQRPEQAAAASVLVGSSASMQALRGHVDDLAKIKQQVLILGETGTGKELVAGLLHSRSPRRTGPFVTVPCSELPRDLLESELFGIERGTASSVDGRVGLLESAAGGTVFLDEIGELALEAQSRLFRFLSERTVRRLGARVGLPVNARVVAATNRNLPSAREEGKFREELRHRLEVHIVSLPPLRDRRDDIAELAEHFRLRAEVATTSFTPTALAELRARDYPGNVRDLMHLIERASLSARGGAIDVEHLGIAQRTNSPRDTDGLRERVLAESRSFFRLVAVLYGQHKLEREDVRGLLGSLRSEFGPTWKTVAARLGYVEKKEYLKFLNFIGDNELRPDDG